MALNHSPEKPVKQEHSSYLTDVGLKNEGNVGVII